MRLLFFSVIFSFSFLCCFSQTKKIYLDEKGNYINSPKKAVNYILISKKADSVYLLRQYDMQDTITMQGTYSDSLLRVANGKFTYYQKDKIDIRLKDVLHNFDESNYIKQVGYYLKGQKTGMWIEFEKKYIKKCSYIYENDKLNGLSQYYNLKDNTIVDIEGNYVDDKKEGVWKTYGFDSIKTPSISDFYLHDKLEKHIVHFVSTDISKELLLYLKDKFSRKLEKLDRSTIDVSFVLNENGKISNTEINEPISPDFDASVIAALSNSPALKPYLYDNKPVPKKMNIVYIHKPNSGNGNPGDVIFSITEKFGKLPVKKNNN